MSVNWDFFDKFEKITDIYLPSRGEGENMASQIVTAVSKLVYKWYNDGDVFDNVHSPMTGWANDLSSYANWLARYTEAEPILDGICDCFNDDDYEELLMNLANALLDEKELERFALQPKVGSIYNCKGYFEFSDCPEEDEEEDLYW